MKSAEYRVAWRWRSDDEGSSNKVDVVAATDAQRAINKVKRQLSAEYSDTNRLFVPVNVVRYE